MNSSPPTRPIESDARTVACSVLPSQVRVWSPPESRNCELMFLNRSASISPTAIGAGDRVRRSSSLRAIRSMARRVGQGHLLQDGVLLLQLVQGGLQLPGPLLQLLGPLPHPPLQVLGQRAVLF